MTVLEFQNYNKWLETPYLENNSLSVIVTSYHTVEYTINLLDSLKENILKMPKISVEVLVYEDHRENDLLQKYVENTDLKDWYYFAVPEELSTNDSMYGRKEGIKKATGKYIAFLDGDDLLTDKAWQCYTKGIELLEKNKNIPIAKFNELLVKEKNRKEISLEKIQKVYNNNILEKLHKDYILNLPEYLSYSKKIHSYPYYMWNKIFKADALKNIKIFLEERYTLIPIWVQKASTGIINICGYIHFYADDNHLQRVIAESRKIKDSRFEREQELKKQFLVEYEESINNHYSNTLKNLLKEIKKSIYI